MTAGTFALMLLAVWPHKSIYLYGENDFLAIYAGAKLAFTNQLYSPEAVRQAQVDAAEFASRENAPFDPDRNAWGLGRELFTANRAHAVGAEQGAASWVA